MSVEPFIGLMAAGALVPIIAAMTSRVRRYIRHGMSDGPIRRLLLTPLGYTKKARDEAAMQAVVDDYHLLGHRRHELRQRNGASERAAPADRP
jgi:hypothetical protein